MSVTGKFAKYVSQNILAMAGMSCYFIADVFFISKAAGTDGIAALNLVLPIYNLIYAFGAMFAIGSATRFTILRARKDEEAEYYFTNAIMYALLTSIIFILVGVFVPEQLIDLLGGNADTIRVGTPYTRTFMCFAPCFMLSQVFNAFVRNDGAPSISMIATLTSSFANIILDYVFMFPLGMGMAGAALATGMSPVISVTICCMHLASKKDTLRIKWHLPSVKRLLISAKLGVSAFIGEISTGITTLVFNVIILGLTGNIGLAAYGVVANFALIAVSVFNGISQGSQPLVSDYYGKGDEKSQKKVLRLAMFTASGTAILMIFAVFALAPEFVDLFNDENSAELAKYGVSGMRIYFPGFVFAGFNIVGIGYLSAVERVVPAFVASISRGMVAITIFAIVLAALFQMTGVWLAFGAAELMTAIITAVALFRRVGTKKKY